MTLVMEGSSFIQCPAGNHLAICYAVIDLGTQHEDAFTWEGAQIAAVDNPKLLIMWEIPNEQVEIDGVTKPAGISKFYNAFWGDRASLRIHLEAWRGRPFNEAEIASFSLHNILGKPCMVNVVHTERGKAKVSGVAPVPKGMVVPKQFNTALFFDLGDYKQEVFDLIPDGIQKMIVRSPEWQKLNPTGFRDGTNEPPNDIPSYSALPFKDSDLEELPF